MPGILSDEQLRAYADQAAAAARDLAALGPQALAAKAVEYPVSGSFAWATAFIYSTLYTNPTLDYSTGEKFTYSGTAWGIGLGAGKLWTVGAMSIPPSQLPGPADFNIAVIGGITYIDFWRNGQRIGGVTGAGLSVGVNAAHGSGEFKRV
jgi:hypothetical protein